MSIREAIRERSRLERMRLGQEVGEPIAIPSMPDIRVQMVPLTEAESQSGVVAASLLDVPDNVAGLHARNRVSVQMDVWNACREPGNLTVHVFESAEEMATMIDMTDIDFLNDYLASLMEYASPAIDGLSEEDLTDLKKAFEETDLSALTGQRWALTKLCCQVLFPELLRVKLLGTSSTDSATLTSESGESTSTALPS